MQRMCEVCVSSHTQQQTLLSQHRVVFISVVVIVLVRASVAPLVVSRVGTRGYRDESHRACGGGVV